jgi:hypothetical protein
VSMAIPRDPKTGIALPPKSCSNTDTDVPPGVTRCLCYAHHMPMYYRTRLFCVVPGESYWLCPMSMGNLKDLLKEYAIAGGEPDIYVQEYFSPYVLAIANRNWYMNKVERKKTKLRNTRVQNELNLGSARVQTNERGQLR